jgi:hypothetical protein
MQNLLKSQVPPYCDIISYLLFESSTSASTGDDKKKNSNLIRLFRGYLVMKSPACKTPQYLRCWLFYFAALGGKVAQHAILLDKVLN